MAIKLPGRATLLTLMILSTLLLGCRGSNNNNNNKPTEPDVPPPPELTYQADIVWTEYGIPHITAQDWGSLGYGYGYAYARENYCTLMREYVRAAGESARYLGEDGNFNDDLVFKLYNSDTRIQRMIDEDLPAYLVDNLSGYVAGINRYLQETGVDNLAEGDEGCRGAEWVRPIDLKDAVRLIHKTVLRASGDPLSNFIAGAQAPAAPVAQARIPAGKLRDQMLVAAVSQQAVDAVLPKPDGTQLGSNAYAVGEQGSQTNSGLLLGNPHFPWQGQLRFFMFHLTMGTEYDVMGAALGGLPAPVIAFTRNLAWSHTVSTGSRFTFYELELNPDNPMQYVYDGQMRDITSETVTAERLAADGTVETVEHTFYFSHYGAIVDLGAVNPLLGGWPNAVGTLLTYRDANLENLRGLDQWVKMGQAADLGEFKTALGAIGIPWVNTIAADRFGDAFYGDISAIPNIPVAKYNNCIRGLLQSLLTDAGFTTMDGSDSACEWDNDADTAPGVFGYANLPKLETREYGANANDSYWLPNPRHMLEGFSRIIGREQVEQTLRTRQTFDQAERRLAGTDGLGDPGFNIDNIRQLHTQSTNYTAGLVLADVVNICSAVTDWSTYGPDTATIAQACDVLSAWDGTHKVSAVGPHIFWEFWQRVRDNVDLWAVPFDPADPVNTPRQLNTANTGVVEAVKQALADGVERLVTAGIPMDRPWGDIQFAEKNGVRYGAQGGSSSMMFSVITSPLVDSEGYSRIVHGNSYIQAITWDESDCPDAYAILTYSQSTDPASSHYADATALYSDSGWIDMPFCESDRDAQEIGRESISE